VLNRPRKDAEPAGVIHLAPITAPNVGVSVVVSTQQMTGAEPLQLANATAPGAAT
jgi:cytochrome c oxidase assembly factor CtaG